MAAAALGRVDGETVKIGQHVAGVITNDQARTDPVSPWAMSTTCKVQVPLASSPANFDSGKAGRYVPVNGAVAGASPWHDVESESSRIVGQELASALFTSR